MDRVHLQVRQAITVSATTRLPEIAGPELVGYGRFLRTAGTHLAVLTQLAHPRPHGLPQLAARLAEIPVRAENASSWSDAATTLGAAHDLLATHLAIRGGINSGIHGGLAVEARTPDADDMIAGTVAGAGIGAGLAIRPVCLLLVDGADATRQLMHAASRVQKPRRDKPIPTALFREATEANHKILLHAKAALWDLDNAPPVHHAHPGSSLAQLRPAASLSLSVSTSGPHAFPSALTALRVLRQLSYDQAQGSTPSSPGSLRDLARLAAAVTDPDLGWLPHPTANPDTRTAIELGTGAGTGTGTEVGTGPETGLDRVRRAHAADHLDSAHAAWRLAAHDLTQTIRGTTTAPPVYQAAIVRLFNDPATLSPAVRLAVLSSLPRLGHDAARTLRHLHEANALHSPRREPAALRVTWRPIDHAHAHRLVQRLESAADLTRPAVASLRPLVDVQVPHLDASAVTPVAPQTPRREPHRSRTVQR